MDDLAKRVCSGR